MKYSIKGDNLQVANIELSSNDVINAEAGAMVFKTGNVKITVETKGIGKVIKRMLTGESLFLTKFSSVGGKGVVGFAGNIPGKIKVITLKKGESLLAEKGAYLCSEASVTLDMKLIKKIGAGFFGGEGFLLQKLTGPGTVFIHAAGDLIEYKLKRGQRMDIDSGHLVAFDPSVDYDIRRVGSIKTTVFGGEGLFLAQLTGPGRVILQSMTRTMLRPKVQRQRGGAGSEVGSMIGGVLKGMTKR